MSDHRCRAEDDAAVRNLLGRTALLGDEGTPEDYRQVYAPGAVWRMGAVEQRGQDEIVAAAAARRADGISGPGTGSRHLLIPLVIEVDGDTARAVSYLAFLSGTAVAVVSTYRDTLVRTSVGWQISERDITC
jgi:SnoaL-like domain